ncbi:Fur family transcriptional regulator [Solidesulfovibrio fructosivorans]|nr:transcriptional repressor [Solidesulfovibrio fructosivorans]
MAGEGNQTSAAAMLTRAGIELTPLRLCVADVLSGEGQALPAADILARVRERHRANKVTLYRILDLFVEKGLAFRHSSGDRAFRYCLGPRFSSRAHCHAYCVRCGRMECLPAPETLVDVAALGERMAMDVVGVEVRIDGVCAACRKAAGEGGETDGPVDAGPGNN